MPTEQTSLCKSRQLIKFLNPVWYFRGRLSHTEYADTTVVLFVNENIFPDYWESKNARFNCLIACSILIVIILIQS